MVSVICALLMITAPVWPMISTAKMLDWVNETTFGANEIETLARWIANGSDFTDRETEDPVASVAYSIMNEAITWIPIMNVPE